jgi:gamma-glutamylcyclotransferase (GGCT)/AIG2-like uncharacterized protein YtfP
LRHDLFCYGSLQIPAVMQAVVGRCFQGRTAELPGYAAFRVRHADFPGLARAPGQAVPGQIYFDLPPAALTILDRFEGRLYMRRRLTVHTRDGRRRGAWAYVIKPDRKTRLTAIPWKRRTFMQRHFRHFMQRFVQDRRPVFDPQAADSSGTVF